MEDIRRGRLEIREPIPASVADALDEALAFVEWFRTMSMEGQITVSEWAANRKPGSDYGLRVKLQLARR